jgi:CheY-like chemotaxis protein
MAERAHCVILIVEDEPLIRMIAVDLLVEHGMVVFEAGCVEEALTMLRADDRIDLLFTDINMPGDLNGLDLAAIAHRQKPSMKLIITSGGQYLAPDQIPDHGTFIAKPYTPRALTQAIDAQLAVAR